MKTDNTTEESSVRISGGKGPSATYKSGLYWEIVGELIWKGVERFEAYEAGKWAKRAERGEEKLLKPDIKLKIY